MLQQEHSPTNIRRISRNSMKTSRVKSIVGIVAKIAVMAGIMYYLYTKGLLDFSRMRDILSRPWLVAAGIAVNFGTATLAVYRWKLLLEGQNIYLSYIEAFRLTLIGMFFNTALPGAVSGDVVKGYYIVKQQPDRKGKSKAFATLFLDRILGVSGLIVVSFLSMALHFKTMSATSALKPLIGLVGMLCAGVVLFYSFMLVRSSVAEKINLLLKKGPGGAIFSKLFEALKCYEEKPGLIAKGFLASLAIHCVIVTLFVSLAGALGGFEQVQLGYYFLLVPLGLLVTAIPIAPAGLGTGHAAFFGLFSLVGSRSGADLFTAFVAFQIALSLFGGVVYLRYKHDHPAVQEPQD